MPKTTDKRRRLRGDSVLMPSNNFLANHQRNIHFWTEFLRSIWRED